MKFIEYAKYIGKSKQYLAQLYNEGRLDEAIYVLDSGKKRINPKIADRIFKGESPFQKDQGEAQMNSLFDDTETLEKFHIERHKKNPKAEVKTKPPEKFNIDSSIDPDEFRTMTYEESKRMKVYYEAKLEKFKLEKEMGKYISREEVEKEGYRTGILIRDKIFAVPGQVSSLITDLDSEFEVKNILLEYLAHAFQEAISRDKYQSFEEVRKQTKEELQSTKFLDNKENHENNQIKNPIENEFDDEDEEEFNEEDENDGIKINIIHEQQEQISLDEAV